MALKHYGKPENDLGEWLDFGLDAPFRLRIRRIPGSVVETIEARHKGKANFEVRDGIRRPVREVEAVADALADKALWAWTDAEGLEVEVADDESAVFWRRVVGDDTIAPGSTVPLAGKALTAEAKKVLIRELRPFARINSDDPESPGKTVEVDLGVFVVIAAGRMQKRFGVEDEARSGN